MSQITTALFAFALALGIGLGCSSSRSEFESAALATATQPAIVEGKVDSPAMVEAKAMFGTVCATCHGPSGRGDGAAAAGLNPKPRDFSEKAWQTGVTDEQISTVILKGGAAIGKSPVMPGNPSLESKPDVVAALVQIIRETGN